MTLWCGMRDRIINIVNSTLIKIIVQKFCDTEHVNEKQIKAYGLFNPEWDIYMIPDHPKLRDNRWREFLSCQLFSIDTSKTMSQINVPHLSCFSREFSHSKGIADWHRKLVNLLWFNFHVCRIKRMKKGQLLKYSLLPPKLKTWVQSLRHICRTEGYDSDTLFSDVYLSLMKYMNWHT